MNFNVRTIFVFERQAKRLLKKFPSLKQELQTLISDLKVDPDIGTTIAHNFQKIRLAIASKGKGKSSGARIITHIIFNEDSVFLLSIYDKSEIENITDKEILELINLSSK